ncbi:MAG TPA: ATP-binding protein [Burkholderiaceae bacterium]|nr:ATP-binding protein [Burkholderiaceae bacterium]
MLIGLLLTLSLTAFVLTFRTLEITPRAEQLAQQIASIVNVTRAAILHSAPYSRRALLTDLAQDESIRVYPLEPDDLIVPLPATALVEEMTQRVRQRLGAETRIVGEVNGVPGVWVSFSIDEDEYWAAIARERIERATGIEWVFWGTAALLLSLLGAAVVVGLVNQPLARIGRAAMQLARGQRPAPLPASNLREIHLVNESFNRMVEDLERIEADRLLILAGISHDLRTPLARLGLEIEMCPIPEETKNAMASDISQMDKIVGQFLDYARPAAASPATGLNLSTIVNNQVEQIARQGVEIETEVASNVRVVGHETELVRAIANLLDNARKYGKRPDDESARIVVRLRRVGSNAVLDVQDSGPGVSPEDLERIKRPFTRADQARSQAGGAGLGLAIVDRMVKRAGGRWRIANRAEGGLGITVELPLDGTQRHSK